jgi:hypothetical protein
MATLWKLKANDQIVLRYLNTAERGRVTAWQQDGWPWDLEFHTGHDTGDPIYIRVTGNTDGTNVPKVDTKTITATELATDLSAVKNYQKLAGGKIKGKPYAALLTTGQQSTLRVFLQTQLPHLKIIGRRYWNAEAVPPDPIVTIVAPTRPCAGTTDCAGLVPNTKGKSSCPVCFQYS